MLSLALGVGLGVGGGPPSLWTPSQMNALANAGTSYWLKPSLAAAGADSSITLVSSKLSAADVGNGKTLIQGTAGNRLSYNAAAPVDGLASYDALLANTASLMSAIGGVTGAAPHAIWGIYSHPDGTTYSGVFTMGSASQSSTVGVASGANLWAGGNGVVQPSCPIDANTHLVVKVYDGTTATLYIDGEQNPAGTPTSVFAYNLTAAFGIGPAFSTAVATSAIRSSGWLTRLLSAAPGGEMRKLEKWARRLMPTTFAKNDYFLGIGDSQTVGYSLTVSPANWPVRMTALGLLTSPVDVLMEAVAGQTTTDVLGNYAGYIKRYTAMRNKCVASVWNATNNFYSGVSGDFSATTAWADNQTQCAALRAQGWYVILINCLPRTQAGTPVGYEAQRVIFNGLMAASGSTVGHVLVDAAAMFPNSDDLTWYQADKVHLNVAAQDRLAAVIAALVNAAPVTT